MVFHCIGVQEYIEAATFYVYNQTQTLASLEDMEKALDNGDGVGPLSEAVRFSCAVLVDRKAPKLF